LAEAYEKRRSLIGRALHDYGLVTNKPVNSLEDLSICRIPATSSIARYCRSFAYSDAFITSEEL